jgi:hypothetical protein
MSNKMKIKIFEESSLCLMDVKLLSAGVGARIGDLQRFLGYQLIGSCSVLASFVPFTFMMLHMVYSIEPPSVNVLCILLILQMQQPLRETLAWLPHFLFRHDTVQRFNSHPHHPCPMEPWTPPHFHTILLGTLITVLSIVVSFRALLVKKAARKKKRRRERKKHLSYGQPRSAIPPFEHMMMLLSHIFFKLNLFLCCRLGGLFCPISGTIKFHKFIWRGQIIVWGYGCWLIFYLILSLAFYFARNVADCFLLCCHSSLFTIVASFTTSYHTTIARMSNRGDNRKGAHGKKNVHGTNGKGTTGNKQSSQHKVQELIKNKELLQAAQNEIWGTTDVTVTDSSVIPSDQTSYSPSIQLTSCVHSSLRGLEKNDDPPAKAVLVFNMTTEGIGSNTLVFQTSASALRDVGVNISGSTFMANVAPSSATAMLGSMAPGKSIALGDIGSTTTTYGRVLNLTDTGQAVGEKLGKGEIPAHLYVNLKLLQRQKGTSEDKYSGFSSFDMVPIYTERSDNMSMSSIMETTSNSRNWVHILNFVFLNHHIVPAIGTICRLFRQLIVEQFPDEESSLLHELIIIKTVSLHLEGNQKTREELKHHQTCPSIAIHMDRDPADTNNQAIFEGIMRRLISSPRATQVKAIIMGIHGVFLVPTPGRNPSKIDVSSLPRDLHQKPLYWLMFSGAPDWCTPIHLHLIFKIIYGIDDIQFVFRHRDMFNSPQTPLATRQATSLVVIFPKADNIKRILKSSDDVKRCVLSLDSSSTTMYTGSSPNFETMDLTLMPGTRVKPTISTDPLVTVQPLSWDGLAALTEEAEDPAHTEIESPNSKRDMNSMEEGNETEHLLSSAKITLALETIGHQIKQETTTDTLSRTLKTLGDSRNAATHTERATVIYQWFLSLVGDGEDREAVIKAWINDAFGSDFQMVDIKEWTKNDAEEQQQMTNSSSSASR